MIYFEVFGAAASQGKFRNPYEGSTLCHPVRTKRMGRSDVILDSLKTEKKSIRRKGGRGRTRWQSWRMKAQELNGSNKHNSQLKKIINMLEQGKP